MMAFHTGDPKIDREHAELVQLFESFDGLTDNATAFEVTSILAKIKDHVILHFVDEEFIFTKQYAMPPEYVERHLAEHERIRTAMLSRIRTMNLDDASSCRVDVGSMRDELVRHIEEIDSQMNQYIGADPPPDGANNFGGTP